MRANIFSFAGERGPDTVQDIVFFLTINKSGKHRTNKKSVRKGRETLFPSFTFTFNANGRSIRCASTASPAVKRKLSTSSLPFVNRIARVLMRHTRLSSGFYFYLLLSYIFLKKTL